MVFNNRRARLAGCCGGGHHSTTETHGTGFVVGNGPGLPNVLILDTDELRWPTGALETDAARQGTVAEEKSQRKGIRAPARLVVGVGGVNRARVESCSVAKSVEGVVGMYLISLPGYSLSSRCC